MAYQQQPGGHDQQGYGQQQYQQYGQQQQQPYGQPGQQQYPPPPAAPQYGQAPPQTQGLHPPGLPGQHQQPGAPATHSGAPSQSQVGHPPAQSDTGSFPGGTYNITHRDTNAVLNVDLQQGGSIRGKSGSMIHMAGTVQLTGKVKFSMKKFFTGGELTESTFAGTGKLALGPTLFGDIIALHLDGRQQWTVGKDAYLACTTDITKDTKAQGIGKAMFSGEDLFLYRVGGSGILWLTSFGAVDRLDLQPGEQHIVDNGHLVAWSCDYKIEKAGGGGMTSMKTGEGLVCRFTGPGIVYVQTRNMDEFESFIAAHARSS